MRRFVSLLLVLATAGAPSGCQHLKPILDRSASRPNLAGMDAHERALPLAGPALAWWPEAVVLRIDGAAGQAGHGVGLLRNNSHRKVSRLLRENAALQSEADCRALADRHTFRRTNPGFWAASDALQQAYRPWAPDEAGLFNQGRL